MKRPLTILPAAASALLLSGCLLTGGGFGEVARPAAWTKGAEAKAETVEAQSLRGWWNRFDDPALSRLVELALEGSPDRRIAEARIAEARGERRSAFGGLLPSIGASAKAGRDKGVAGQTDDFYDAGFDASYELDLFGRNRQAFSAARSGLKALEARYEDVSLSLAAEVARTYAELQGARRQAAIARRNLEIQEKTLGLVRQLMEAGEAPRLDVERAENQVNTTRSSIPEFERQAENAALGLVVLTGLMPADLAPLIAEERPVPGGEAAPVLVESSVILARRPDIRAAALELEQRTALTRSAAAEIFPVISLSSFFGVSERGGAGSVSIWNVAAGAAATLLDFGRIQGRVDSARAREVQAYETYRRTVLQAVADVESALVDYVKVSNRRASLAGAYGNAERALGFSQDLYREGEISFLDVLDVQRAVNDSQSALVGAEIAQAQALIRLYKALSVGF